jgi:hypothetical protein
MPNRDKELDARRQLRLKIERISEGIYRKAFELEFMKRAIGIFNGLRKVRDCTVWRGRRPTEQENKDRTLWRGRPPRKGKKNLLALLAMLA